MVYQIENRSVKLKFRAPVEALHITKNFAAQHRFETDENNTKWLFQCQRLPTLVLEKSHHQKFKCNIIQSTTLRNKKLTFIQYLIYNHLYVLPIAEYKFNHFYETRGNTIFH